MISENLKKFNKEKTVVRGNNVCIYGNVDDEKMLLEITIPKINSETFDLLKNTPHHLQLKNDAYETATVKIESECIIKMKRTENNLLKPYFEYCCESYDDYISSEVDIINIPEIQDAIYEDETVRIYSCKQCNMPNDICWICLFKESNVNSVRDLSNQAYLNDLKKLIQSFLEKYKISEDMICMYFDYSGKKSSLLLNIVSISNSLHKIQSNGCFIYFDAFLKNISIDPEYYCKDMFYIQKKTENI